MDNTDNQFKHTMRQLESLNSSIRLHEKEIERRFSKFSHTPDHPPYASMIQEAILELNDQGGSSEEAISKFIETEYNDLPIGHASYLSHHLQKLIAKGEIVHTSGNCYLLPGEYSDSVHKSKGQKKLRKFVQGMLPVVKGVQSQQKQTIEEGQECNQVCEKISEGAEEQKQSKEQRTGSIGENKEPGDAVLIEELSEVEEAQYRMTEVEQYKEAEEYDLMQEQQNHRQQMELTVQESQVEGNADKEGHQTRKNDEVTEIEIQEVQKDLVTEELCHSEQNSEKPGDSNLIRDPECEAREEQVESVDIQIETMAEEINMQEQCQVLCETIEEEESHQVRTSGEVTEKVVREVQEDVVIEEALLREQRSETPVESNPIQELESEGREAQAAQVAEIQIETMEEQQGQCFELSFEEKKLQELQLEVCHQIMDLSNSLVQFVKKKKEDKVTATTHYDTANLGDQFRSSHLTKKELKELLKKTYKIGAKLNDIIDTNVLKYNNLKPTPGMKQKNSLENHPQQTKETCRQGNESSLVHDCQPQQHEIRGQPEVSESQPKTTLASDSVFTSLMGLEQSCQIELPTRKRSPEVEITVSEGLNGDENKLMKLSDQQKAFLLQPNSLHDKNESSQGVVGSIEMILEENREPPTTEPNINLSTDHQQEITLRDVAMPPEFKLGQEQQPENLVEGRPTEHELMQQQMQGQKLQEQLPPSSQMLFKAKVTTATSTAKLRVQRKKMPDQHQLRKLRPRGPRPSKHESVHTTIEADNDFTLASLKAKLKRNLKASINRRQEMQGSQTEVEISQSTEQETPLNHKRQQKDGHKAVVKISQHIERQVKHHGQIKRLKSQPTRITTVDSASSSQQLTQEQSHSQSESVVVESTEESLPLRNLQSEEVKLWCQRRGRRPKVKPDVEPSMIGFSVLNHEDHEQKQSPCGTRGRPSKRKANADASVEGSLLSDHQNHEKQHQRQAQGRPWKKKTNADASMEGSSKRGRGRPSKLKLSSNVDLTLTSNVFK